MESNLNVWTVLIMNSTILTVFFRQNETLWLYEKFFLLATERHVTFGGGFFVLFFFSEM